MDLGSTFPKAKPKQSLLTVIRLAVLRYILFPLYAKWWVAQTSLRIFAFLLFLYILQMINWAIYSYNVNRGHNKANDSDTCSAIYTSDKPSAGDNDSISITELLMPMSLSLLLSLIHSQIVATSSSNLSKSDAGKTNPLQLQRKKRERRKRRKGQPRCKASTNASSDILSQAKQSSETNDACKEFHAQISQRKHSHAPNEVPAYSGLDEPIQAPLQSMISTSSQLRKRNVNWCASIKYQSMASMTQTFGMPANVAHTANANNVIPDGDNDYENVAATADDDGFESLNGKSSSGEEMTAMHVETNQTNDSNEEVTTTEADHNEVTKCAYTTDILENDTELVKLINHGKHNRSVAINIPENVSVHPTNVVDAN